MPFTSLTFSPALSEIFGAGAVQKSQVSGALEQLRGAVNAVAADMRVSRVESIWAKSFTTATFMPGTNTVIQRQNNNWSIWLPVTAAGTPASDYQQDATGQWWKRVVGDLEVSDLQAGRVQSQWSKTFASTTFKPGVNTVIQSTETTWGIWLLRPAQGTPAERFQQDAQGQWWCRVVGDEDLAAITARAGTPRLEAVAGTPDAATASMPAAWGTTLPKSGDWLWYVPAGTNNAGAPTLTIGTAGARTLRDEAGVNLPPQRLVPGVPHLIRIVSNGAADVIGVTLGLNDLASLRSIASGPSTQTRAAFLPVVQSAAALPSRPDAQVVYWHTWSDPTALMGGADLWVQQASPVVPAAPLPAEWDLLDARTGDGLVIRLSSIPDPVPPLTAVEYQVGGGTWVRVNGAKRGDDLIVSGLTTGQAASIAIRYRNYLGNGPGSTAKSRAPTSGAFADSFNRANGPLTGKWALFGDGGTGDRMLMVNANALIAGNTNESYSARVTDEYFPPDQFVQAQIINTGTMGGMPRGIFLWARANPTLTDGYCLRLAGTAWYLERYRGGVSYRLGSGTIPAGQLPAFYRLECRGMNLQVIRGATMVLDVQDASMDRLSSGGVAITLHNGASDPQGTVRIDDFSAGRAV